MTEEGNILPLSERPVKDLIKLLADLEKQELEIMDLKSRHPDIDLLQNDTGLPEEKYKIWQTLSYFSGVQARIKKVKLVILEKEKI